MNVRHHDRRIRTDVLLTGTGVLFLVAYAWPILDPGLSDPWISTCRVVTWTTWGLFAVDYAVRWWAAPDRGRFVRRHPWDLAVVVLPLIQPLRLVTMLSVLNRYAGASLRGRVAVYVAGSTALLLFTSALAVLDAERGHEDANLASFGDALWWGVATVTTAGYGDHYPVTTTGRFVAAALMVAGIGLLGIVTASLASWLLERVSQVEEESQAATRRDLAALVEQVAALRAELAGRDGLAAAGTDGPGRGPGAGPT